MGCKLWRDDTSGAGKAAWKRLVRRCTWRRLFSGHVMSRYVRGEASLPSGRLLGAWDDVVKDVVLSGRERAVWSALSRGVDGGLRWRVAATMS
jgi:hypothetical protein